MGRKKESKKVTTRNFRKLINLAECLKPSPEDLTIYCYAWEADPAPSTAAMRKACNRLCKELSKSQKVKWINRPDLVANYQQRLESGGK